jgi:predicted dinucleotide-binding enzyme
MQELLPDSLVVGALVQPARWQKDAEEVSNARGYVYLASDSADAKAAVAELYTRAGFQTNDFGGLRMSRMLEQLQLIRLVPLLQGESYGLDVVVTPADEKGAQ